MKQQDDNQLKGRWGELMASLAFPLSWVVRPLPHDYGVDLQVEVFRESPNRSGRARYEATGAHLSCQVKTSDAKPGAGQTIGHRVNVHDLLLAESMGAGSPLVLLYVDRTTPNIYYLCLTDYVPKVLDKEVPLWRNQKTVKLPIPKRNALDPSKEPEGHWNYLGGLAYRSKLYSAFNAAQLAHGALKLAVDSLMTVEPGDITRLAFSCKEFDRALKDALALEPLDVWADSSPYRGFADTVRELFKRVRKAYAYTEHDFSETTIDGLSDADLAAFHVAFATAAEGVAFCIGAIASLGGVYEQTHREGRLREAAIPYDLEPSEGAA